MKLHRFYIPSEKLPESLTLEKGERITLSFPELVHQLKSVLKLHTGEKLVFFNGNKKEYVSSLISYEGKKDITLLIEEIVPNDVSFNKEIFLFFSIIKKDNVEWILEKGTEIGVTHFIPLLSSRSEKKDLNIERSTKILMEASEQCGRNTLPSIYPVMKLKDVFDNFTMSFIVFEKNTSVLNMQEIKDTRIGLLIGPEGGWTEEEIEFLKTKNVFFRSLGETTLRAETAAIVGSAIVLQDSK